MVIRKAFILCVRFAERDYMQILFTCGIADPYPCISVHIPSPLSMLNPNSIIADLIRNSEGQGRAAVIPA